MIWGCLRLKALDDLRLPKMECLRWSVAAYDGISQMPQMIFGGLRLKASDDVMLPKIECHKCFIWSEDASNQMPQMECWVWKGIVVFDWELKSCSPGITMGKWFVHKIFAVGDIEQFFKAEIASKCFGYVAGKMLSFNSIINCRVYLHINPFLLTT